MSWISFPLPDGEFFWRVRPRDVAGYFGAWSDVWSFNIDTDAPILEIPVVDDFILGIMGINFTWTGYDANPANYTVSMNGEEIASGNWTSGETFSYPLDELLVGDYVFEVILHEAPNNSVSLAGFFRVLSQDTTTTATFPTDDGGSSDDEPPDDEPTDDTATDDGATDNDPSDDTPGNPHTVPGFNLGQIIGISSLGALTVVFSAIRRRHIR